MVQETTNAERGIAQGCIHTGAGGEIGTSIAHALARDRMALVLTDIESTTLKAIAGGFSSPVEVYAHDVTDFGATREIVEDVIRRHGQIECVVNCAGLYEQLEFRTISPERWRQSISVNLDGVFNTIRCIVPVLSEESAIVNIASVAGHRGSIDHTAYAAAKGAVLTLTRSLAQELAPRTRVNAVSPGLIDTKMLKNLDSARVQLRSMRSH